MRLPHPDFVLAAVFPLAAIGALAACQPTTSEFNYDYSAERVAECVQTACTQLGLDYTQMQDYADLAELSHVTALMLGNTNFADLGDIASMTQLRELHIGNTNVRDLSGLAAFPNLRLLHIQDVEPTSWAPLADLRSLQELVIGHSGMRDFSIVAEMPQLRRLMISRVGPETDLSGLGRNPGLQSVHLDGDGLPDLSPLLNLPNLREVSMEAFDETRHADVIARLRAQGVRVSLTEPVIVAC